MTVILAYCYELLMKPACVRRISWCKFVWWCGRLDADVTEGSEYNAMNSIPLSQLLMEMNADSSESHPDSQPQLSHEYQCRCITVEHQPASICIEHFTISSDDERNLNNIAGKTSDLMHIIVVITIFRVA